MSLVAIRVAADIGRLEKAVAARRDLVAREIARGLNEGGDKVRTQVRRAMRRQTGLLQLQSVIKRSSTIRAYAGQAGSPHYDLIFRGKPATKPNEFRFTVKRGKGGGVTVWFWGLAHKLKRSFQIVGSGLRARLGSPRFPIRGFDGPNLAKEALKGDVASTFERESRTVVAAIIAKRLSRLI